MESFTALLALCAGNSLATGEFPSQKPVTQNFGVLFALVSTYIWVIFESGNGPLPGDTKPLPETMLNN